MAVETAEEVMVAEKAEVMVVAAMAVVGTAVAMVVATAAETKGVVAMVVATQVANMVALTVAEVLAVAVLVAAGTVAATSRPADVAAALELALLYTARQAAEWTLDFPVHTSHAPLLQQQSRDVQAAPCAAGWQQVAAEE